MQDFKHIDKHHRRRKQPGNARVAEGRNAFKELQETKPQKRRLKVILPIVALLLASFPIISLFGSPRSKAAVPVAKAAPAPVPLTSVDNWGAFRLAAEAYPNVSVQGGSFSAPLAQGGRVIYAINEPM